MKINELIEIPKRKDEFGGTHADVAICIGYNQALSEISQIEIPPEKLFGMVEFNEHELLKAISEYHSSNHAEGVRIANSIILNKSKILKLKPTLDT